LAFFSDLRGLHWPTACLTYALGGIGGWLAMRLHLPLPMMLGSLTAVGLAAVLNLRPLGRLPQAPQSVRMLFVPIIGVSIGAAVTPALLTEARHWWPTLLAVLAFVPLVHVLCFRAVIALGATDRVTAFFGTAPGGLIETVEMGTARGADVQMLVLLQFLRLILVIVAVPLAFSVMAGHPVGSAGGAIAPGSGLPLGPPDIAVLAVAAILGAGLGLRLRLPAGHVTGPILLSGAAHLGGLVQGAPPAWLVWAAQVVIGTSLGVRFSDLPRGAFRRGLALAALNVAITCTVALGLALSLNGLVAEPASALFLAFAPGGLVEMGLVALSLNMSPLYVTAHHVLRIVMAVTVARIGSRRV
jgi:hypothetical protein